LPPPVPEPDLDLVCRFDAEPGFRRELVRVGFRRESVLRGAEFRKTDIVIFGLCAVKKSAEDEPQF
jgi:hypothetical protein